LKISTGTILPVSLFTCFVFHICFVGDTEVRYLVVKEDLEFVLTILAGENVLRVNCYSELFYFNEI
jgi:hypothetical protein